MECFENSKKHLAKYVVKSQNINKLIYCSNYYLAQIIGQHFKKLNLFDYDITNFHYDTKFKTNINFFLDFGISHNEKISELEISKNVVISWYPNYFDILKSKIKDFSGQQEQYNAKFYMISTDSFLFGFTPEQSTNLQRFFLL